ncbi:Hg(II)-responsive transcriptional regulator [Salinicola sp. JS01]|uniref:Hg(II)-responsive transcriptional regulator n=1 Tax=Salinicola sp. JS01 TaxID=3050071 RepID=UPI00255B73A9|nr:Hg(II)-responsive transcriptional regulator [Salinicola sp. JS01]WIX32616.1 Hg(II)-responsive transcriptional regulator [Salinicola sp. JS01]
MQDEEKTLTIGSLAKVSGVHVETIRYYQRRGLLPEPRRPPGGIRRYGSSDIERLNFVKTAQQVGFSLNEIGDLLRLDDGTHCQEAGALAEHKLRDVREKLDRLERIEKLLNELVTRCHAHQGNITCPLIASLHEGIETDGSR